jgi:uncharacterized membrane protein YeiH
MVMYYLDLFGVVVFAISGALEAGKKRMDLFGVLILAVVTALGGGTLRDVILGNQPVAWVRDNTYLWSAIAAGLFTFIAGRFVHFPRRMLLVADALGLAVFAVIGSEVALSLGMPTLIVAVMGMMSAVMGGLIRDVLANEIPLIFQKEIYATAAILGSLTYVLTSAWMALNLATLIAVSVGFGVRMLAIRYKVALPLFLLTERASK